MATVTRSIEKDGIDTWCWSLGHDSLMQSKVECRLPQHPHVIKPNRVTENIAVYKFVGGNESIADVIMRNRYSSKLADYLTKDSSFTTDNLVGYTVDAAVFDRVLNFLKKIRNEGTLTDNSINFIIDYLNQYDRSKLSGYSGTDTTIGLGRIVCHKQNQHVVFLAPPDGLHPNAHAHRDRILGETMIFATLYSLGNKTNVVHCRDLYHHLKNCGWVNNDYIIGPVIAILDHGRRRLKGESVPLKTLESIIAIANGYLHHGFTGFERILNE